MSGKFLSALNDHVEHEFAAHQQYIAIAVHYDAETLPRLATFFYRQALEERDHAMMIVKYLLDNDHDVSVPGAPTPESSFSDLASPVRMALAQEQDVTERFNALAGLARDEGDYQGEQFLQWFLKEQVEEVSTMSALLTIVERGADNPLLVEEYLAREGVGGAGEDPTAPPVAGG